jgi:hypothetical protein
MDLDELRKQNNMLYDKNLSLREEISYLREKIDTIQNSIACNSLNLVLLTITVCVLLLVPGIWDNFITVLQFFGAVIMAAIVTETGNAITVTLIGLGLYIWYGGRESAKPNIPPRLPNR